MRMWMVNPKILCTKHLQGEHFEIHKHKHVFEKGYSVEGRLYPVVQIEPNSMKKRHDELAEEMLRRGGNHNSPYIQPDLSNYNAADMSQKVDVEQSIKDLINRCQLCKQRYESLKIRDEDLL